MLFFRSALLVEDIPDVFGAIGFVGNGFSDGADERDAPVFVHSRNDSERESGSNGLKNHIPDRGIRE